MNRCLQCGAVRRGKKKSYACPTCHGHTIPVTRNMVKLAEQFHRMGYIVSKAESFIRVYDESHQYKSLVVEVVFGKGYIEDAFPQLPTGFDYYYYPVAEPNSCCIVHHENYFTFGKLTDSQAEKEVIKRLYDWAIELEARGCIDILTLAGIV